MSGKRSRARRHVLQGLYQWQMAGQDIRDIINQFLDREDAGAFDVDYFRELLRGVPARLNELDEALAPCLDRAIKSVDPVERAGTPRSSSLK